MYSRARLAALSSIALAGTTSAMPFSLIFNALANSSNSIVPANSSSVVDPTRTSNPTCSDYSAFNTTAFIPFVSNMAGWNEDAQIAFSIDGNAGSAIVDTGSTGFVVSIDYFKDFNSTGLEEGHVYYISSDILEEGYWMQKLVTLGSGANAVVSNISVFAETAAVKCPGYNATTDGQRCPKSKQVGSSKKTRASGIAYMGIGFGHDKGTTSQAKPNTNAFLNVVSVNGATVSNATYHNGYTVSTAGIHLGLTAANTANYSTGQLPIGDNYATDTRSWGAIPINGRINNSAIMNGSILFDTGVPEMLLTTNVTTPADSKSQALNGTIVSANIMDIATYNYTTGDTSNPMMPIYARVYTTTAKTLGINTSRRFFNEFMMMFDAVDGTFGLNMTGVAGPYASLIGGCAL